MVHVIPLDDAKEHSMATDCHCEPRVDYIDPDTDLPWEGDGPLVVHNAFDCRELFE